MSTEPGSNRLEHHAHPTTNRQACAHTLDQSHRLFPAYLEASSHPQAQWRATLGRATWSGRLTALYPGAANNTELIPFAEPDACVVHLAPAP